MTTDVTELTERYRLALRSIWNCYFWPDPSQRNWESVASFRSLKLPLFRALLGDRLGVDCSGGIFGNAFQVVPVSGDGSELPRLLVNRRVPSSPSEGYWELLEGPFRAEGLSLTLVDYFDWSPLDCLDLRYYVVSITCFSEFPDKVGQHALVDVSYAKVMMLTPDTGNSSA